MTDYYKDKLSAERLEQVYDIAPPRVQQYLQAEMEHVLASVSQDNSVLDLGCGYGRTLPALAAKARLAVGIDNSLASLRMAHERLSGVVNCFLILGDAANLPFQQGIFDVLICIQNGISAFQVDQRSLIRESLRVVKKGGTVLFSSYADAFWDHRLQWFERQAHGGFLGEIDYARTGGGIIVCKDGFQATTVGPERFLELAAGLGARVSVEQVDGSSVFCRLVKD